MSIIVNKLHRMIKDRIINIGLIVLFASILSSCTEIIDMEFSTDFERLVVDARIMDKDTVQYVKLSKINLDNEVDIVSPITNASVVVYDGQTEIVFDESEIQNGTYIAPSNFIGEWGKTYTLNITQTGVVGVDGTDTYSASALMADSLKFDSTTVEYFNIPHMGMIGYNIMCWALDTPTKNYYLFKAWKNSVLLTDTLYEYRQSDDQIFNGTYIAGASCQFLSDYKPDEYVESGDTITLEIDNIDQAYFDYLNSAQSEDQGTIPMFGGPPANVTTNVSNGAVGIFRVYSVNKSSVVVEEVNRY